MRVEDAGTLWVSAVNCATFADFATLNPCPAGCDGAGDTVYQWFGDNNASYDGWVTEQVALPLLYVKVRHD